MPDTNPVPRPVVAWSPTRFWYPINKAWQIVDNKTAVNRMTIVPSSDNITAVHRQMIEFNKAVEKLMRDDNYTVADVAGWMAELQSLLDRLRSHMKDSPLVVACNVAAFVAGTSPEFCDAFESRHHPRDMVLTTNQSIGFLYTITLPQLLGARGPLVNRPDAPVDQTKT